MEHKGGGSSRWTYDFSAVENENSVIQKTVEIVLRTRNMRIS